MVNEPVAQAPILGFIVDLVGISPRRTPVVESVVPFEDAGSEAWHSWAGDLIPVVEVAHTASFGPGVRVVRGHVSCDSFGTRVEIVLGKYVVRM